jgi:hypothetical protein
MNVYIAVYYNVAFENSHCVVESKLMASCESCTASNKFIKISGNSKLYSSTKQNIYDKSTPTSSTI